MADPTWTLQSVEQDANAGGTTRLVLVASTLDPQWMMWQGDMFSVAHTHTRVVSFELDRSSSGE